jgi:hypothetical protein
MQSLFKEKNMKTNESTLDRIIRIVLGIALLGLRAANVVMGTLGWVFLIVGAIALVTGLIGFCPLYTLLKIKTKKA